MATHTASMILYAALHSMQPCEKVFVDTAKSANSRIRLDEQVYLEEFAKAACATSNPDILWLLALQETNFRFVIIRENKGNKFSIKEGAPAIAYLKKLKKKSKGRTSMANVDIGVMQFNWRWHGEGFKNDPIAALSPKNQVKYFVDKYSRQIFNSCDQDWVGCYHNQADESLSSQYQADITKKTLRLAGNALNFIKDTRSTLTGEVIDSMPPVVAQDFFTIFSIAKTFPSPPKNVAVREMRELASE